MSLLPQPGAAKAPRKPSSTRWHVVVLILFTALVSVAVLATPRFGVRLLPMIKHRLYAQRPIYAPQPSSIVVISHHPAELEPGTWAPRNPPYTEDNMERLYNGFYSHTERLPALPDGQTRTEQQEERESLQRAIRLANWAWMGTEPQDDLSWDKWIVRLMQSVGGLVILGDSIQLQLFYHFMESMPHGFRVEEEWSRVYGGLSEQPSYLRAYLHNDGPLASSLLAYAKVPPERLSRPLITFIRDDLFLSLDEILHLRDAVVANDSEWPARAGVAEWEAGENGVSNCIFGDWQTKFQDALTPIHVSVQGKDTESESPLWFGSHNTIFSINSGAHWNGLSIHGLSHPQVLSMYNTMVEKVYPILASLPQSTIIYRPTFPGQPNCDPYTSPFPGMNQVRSVMSEQLPDYANMAWDMFDVFNEIWYRHMFGGEVLGPDAGGRADAALPAFMPAMTFASASDVYVDAHGHGGAMKRADFEWLPVWQRTLMRPDAHRLGGDCLHFEGPAVLNEWKKSIQYTVAMSEPEQRWHLKWSRPGHIDIDEIVDQLER